MNLELISGEEVVFKSPASVERAAIRHDGKLILTNRRLHFGGIGEVGWTYDLKEMSEIKLKNAMWLFPSGISVSFKDGFAEKILVHNREGWVQKILAAKAVVESGRDPISSQSVDSWSPKRRATLRTNLEKHFNKEELQNICFELNVDFENLEGDTKQAKARELVLWFERVGRLEELLQRCKEERPSVDWDT